MFFISLVLISRVSECLFLDLPDVLLSVSDIDLVRRDLGRAIRVRVIQELLDAEDDLLDGDCGAPVLLLVQDGQADRPRGVDVGVEEPRGELALGGPGGELLRELEGEGVHAALPDGALRAGDAAVPEENVGCPVGVDARPCKEHCLYTHIKRKIIVVFKK